MKSTLRKVIMSKKVASEYLKKVADASSTLTVYVAEEPVLVAFLEDMKEGWGKKVSYSRGFDFVTFVSTDNKVVQLIQEEAHRRGFYFSDF